MNTNDLPPAAKLAVLIEAGAAANPDLRLDGRGFFSEEEKRACALSFAALANGAQRSDYSAVVVGIAALGLRIDLSIAVQCAAMLEGATVAGICQSLREGALAKLPA